MTDELKKDFTLRISNANRSELLVIVYEMLLVYLDDSKVSAESSDEAGYKEGIRKAKGCFDELINGLDSNYEISQNLLAIYVFCIKELVQAEIKIDPSKIDDVIKLVTPIKNSFAEIAKTDTSESLMANTQSVVAGYTYGRNDISEAVNTDTNRGFLA